MANLNSRLSLSILLPTIGRRSLFACLGSMLNQDFRLGDEILLISDGPSNAKAISEQFDLPIRYMEVDGPNRDWGHTPRNLLMKEAQGDFLLHFDDDDIYRPHAIASIRERLEADLSKPHLFRMWAIDKKEVIWRTEELESGNVSTQCIAHPNDGKFGVWKPFYGGDFYFIFDTCRMHGGVVWEDLIICNKTDFRVQ
jgi:glycosyltransferase involved in cell wall biosynthesis